ncbi:MAG: S24/S26 family peptidase [Coriobacteriia bacterium]|nr:S24/S26 family peptidase [Coriobacteriia bacterium]
MQPTLAPGDLVVYRRGGRGAGEGDIVFFDKEGWPGGVLHRVVCLEPDGSLRTCGDANDVPDREYVDRTYVRGVVVAVLPLGKTWGAMRSGVRDCATLSY